MLRANIYVAAPTPWYKPNGTEGGPWSPISCTLIHGNREAVLVDTPITKQQNIELADWIASIILDKNLKNIYITHGHGDHWFGTNYLLKRFPGVKVLATAGTIAHMKSDAANFDKSWGRQFPNLIDTNFVFAEAVSEGTGFEIEGQKFLPVEVGHSDTHDSTILWIPSIKLAVCGDVVYGDCHQMLAAANTPALRAEWIKAAEKVEALKPESVVPGHMRESEAPGTYHLGNTKKYIRDFGDILNGGAKSPRELSAKMVEKWPSRFNIGALAMGCAAAFKGKEKEKGNEKL